MTFTETLPRDPAALPGNNNPGHDVTHWFELSPAPWFGMSICDPNSYPQTKCTPNSDTNAPHGTFPGGGAAFMEMQFYPPGFAPFSDSVSCNNTHWCAALNIDSLEATDHSGPNPNCEEPVNFAFIQRNGVPAGPPSPQLSNGATFTPNSQTLMMNPGDVVRTHMFDASLGGGKHAFKIVISDLTTGQSGFMIASAANGFMNTNYVTCAGTPFNFQPLFNTARAANSDRLVGAAVRHPHPVRDRALHPVQARHRAVPRGDPTPPGRPATGPTRTRDRPTAPRRARK